MGENGEAAAAAATAAAWAAPGCLRSEFETPLLRKAYSSAAKGGTQRGEASSVPRRQREAGPPCPQRELWGSVPPPLIDVPQSRRGAGPRKEIPSREGSREMLAGVATGEGRGLALAAAPLPAVKYVLMVTANFPEGGGRGDSRARLLANSLKKAPPALEPVEVMQWQSSARATSLLSPKASAAARRPGERAFSAFATALPPLEVPTSAIRKVAVECAERSSSSGSTIPKETLSPCDKCTPNDCMLTPA